MFTDVTTFEMDKMDDERMNEEKGYDVTSIDFGDYRRWRPRVVRGR